MTKCACERSVEVIWFVGFVNLNMEILLYVKGSFLVQVLAFLLSLVLLLSEHLLVLLRLLQNCQGSYYYFEEDARGFDRGKSSNW